jgi:hypothetical protein
VSETCRLLAVVVTPCVQWTELLAGGDSPNRKSTGRQHRQRAEFIGFTLTESRHVVEIPSQDGVISQSLTNDTNDSASGHLLADSLENDDPTEALAVNLPGIAAGSSDKS